MFVSKRKNLSIRLYKDPQPRAEILLQNKLASIVSAEFAIKKPKDQIARAILAVKKILASLFLWFIKIILNPKYKYTANEIKNMIENNILIVSIGIPPPI